MRICQPSSLLRPNFSKARNQPVAVFSAPSASGVGLTRHNGTQLEVSRDRLYDQHFDLMVLQHSQHLRGDLGIRNDRIDPLQPTETKLAAPSKF